jgi:hypothetical protein
MDDCESFKPTPEDKTFLNEFVVAMSSFYDMERDRQTKFWNCSAPLVLSCNQTKSLEPSTRRMVVLYLVVYVNDNIPCDQQCLMPLSRMIGSPLIMPLSDYNVQQD